MPSETPSDAQALRKRLQRLGRARTRPKGPKRTKLLPQEISLKGGVEIETPFNSAYCILSEYPVNYRHGTGRLGEFLVADQRPAAEIARDPSLAETETSRWIFLDTETTGLSGGAGTIVFLVGIGRFEDGLFRLRQYFLRDPGEERGMLHALAGHFADRPGCVTFNGRAFDMPLLDMRFTLGLRDRPRLNEFPQMDLLYPARRLWRRELPNCTLGTIEQRILAVQRSEQDVPGELIPGLYHEYLRTGDTLEMERVLYHNAVDILSLVTLTTEILRRHAAQPGEGLSAAEALGVGRWQEARGKDDKALAIYQSALPGAKVDVRVELLRRTTMLLKRRAQREQALDGWREWHRLSPRDPRPCVELAMYYEWHAREVEAALHWAREARESLQSWPADWRRRLREREIEHRIRRLERKSARSARGG